MRKFENWISFIIEVGLFLGITVLFFWCPVLAVALILIVYFVLP